MSAARSAGDTRLDRAARHVAQGEALQAEMLLLAVVRERPLDSAACMLLAHLALERDDRARAAGFLRTAASALPDESPARLQLADLLLQAGAPEDALRSIESVLRHERSHPAAWLLLGNVRDMLGDTVGALKARHQAFRHAHGAGRWLDAATTEPELRNTVALASQRFVKERREHLMAALDELRAAHGGQALGRVERALDGYLGFADATPADTRQRPSFLYFQGLPDAPYHDPFLQPWAGTLQAHWGEMRREAQALLDENTQFRSFLDLQPGSSREAYVAGQGQDGAGPAWDAFFFYRHGRRYDENHQRCPATSALLESIALCRIDRIAPEICFSVLRPGSKIMPHHGVTNTRLVFHLPLIVPEHCALHIVGAGQHDWREGQPMMFDDTYQHEAWNLSGSARVILLMDCWNPHLTPVERIAVKQLVESIDALENQA